MVSSIRFRNPFQTMSTKAKLTALALGTIYGTVILAVILIGPATIFQYVVAVAQWLALQPHGRLMVIALICICSFPPMVGYSNSITLCGLAFGSKAGKTPQSPNGHTVWEGFLIAVAGAMLGSTLAFLVLRLVNRRFRRAKWLMEIKESRQWVAMSKAVKDRGFGVIVLIRCCPFPFVWSNLFFASMDTVTLPSFALATLLSTPRLLLHVYIGSVTYSLLDAGERAAMPLHVKVIDIGSIFAGIALGAGTGYYLWKQMNRILQEEEPIEVDGEDLERREGRQPLLAEEPER